MVKKVEEDELLTPLDMIKKEKFLEERGFRCGLEIHRRMKGRKLFCSCSAETIDMEIKESARVVRFMRVGEGEEGKVDRAAVEEVKKHKIYEYLVYKEGVCLVDLDEEPPHEVNREALEYGLKTALLLNSKIPEEVLFMRKVVVDGSNTTGFQRTALIGLDGYIETKKGRVGIQTVCLEEESAQIVEAKEDRIIYDLRRLGIPLIEIATSPSIKDGEHCREVAKQLGDMLRYTFFYQRGLGSIRQDINISIKEGARVEIKGVQDVDMIPLIVAKEVQRQLSWIEFGKRFNKEDYRIGELKEVTNYFEGTRSKLFSRAKVFMFPIYKAKGMFSLRLTDTRTIGNEIAGRLKVKTALRGMVHTDEDIKKYSIIEEVENIRKGEKIGEEDLLIFFITNDRDLALKGREIVIESFFLLFQKPQEETRRVNDKGDTEYLRPLPGSARMYPETDVPPIPVDIDVPKYKRDTYTKERIVREINAFLNFEHEEGKKEKIKEELLDSKYLDIFLSLSPHVDNKYRRDFVMLILNKFKEWERTYHIDILSYPTYIIENVLNLYFNSVISREAIPLLFVHISKRKKEWGEENELKAEIRQIIKEKNLHLLRGERLEKEITKEIENIIKEIDNKVDVKKLRGRLLSEIRERFKYRGDPREVVEKVNLILKHKGIEGIE